MTTAAEIARDLLRIGAVSLRPDDPFTWASGRLSPVYTDNRLILSYPEVRSRVADAFLQALAEAGEVDAVSATATAGIPHGALLADRAGLPFSYVRSAAKGHGRQNRIEGRVEAGQRLVLVEDLVSTGGSVLSAAEALREAGAEVVAVLAVFTYGFPEAERAFAEAGVPLVTLTDFTSLADAARQSGALADGALTALHDWRADPTGWSERRRGEG
ncbi:orotate phosphoribosyltransferase [Rubrivirga marina]|uniref:Orotate phosphoribosyltransferase n=1 Tax=Rubrivirga marina TaxID=1196024 RepID=A0A271J4G1_9BACT|nr:orotate phosphoribosyltransferase [Rubrivirga marina]PAP77845.1 orotate phosphoribosyltransferase [Rubrivirga marina]